MNFKTFYEKTSKGFELPIWGGYYGAWIGPKFEVVKVKSIAGHTKVLKKKLKWYKPETIEDYWPVMKKGWIRVIFPTASDRGLIISATLSALKKSWPKVKEFVRNNVSFEPNDRSGIDRLTIDFVRPDKDPEFVGETEFYKDKDFVGLWQKKELAKLVRWSPK